MFYLFTIQTKHPVYCPKILVLYLTPNRTEVGRNNSPRVGTVSVRQTIVGISGGVRGVEKSTRARVEVLTAGRHAIGMRPSMPTVARPLSHAARCC